MNIRIKVHRLELSRELRSTMERRICFALGRFGEAIRDVTVRLTDLNGPKGGIDKECLMVVKLRYGGEVLVQSNGKESMAALNYCADRMGRSVERELSRNQKIFIRKNRRRR